MRSRHLARCTRRRSTWFSATDIVAGSLDQYLSKRQPVPIGNIEVKQGYDLVLQRLTHDGLGPKKMNVIKRPGENETIEVATLEFNLKKSAAGRDHHSGCRPTDE